MFAYIPHELSLLQTLAEFRVEWLNPFIIMLNNCDTGPFYILLGALGFIYVKPKFGQRLWVLFAIVFVTTYFLKGVLMQPRPLGLDPALGLLKFNSKYGLPSGAAMASTSMAILVGHHVQSKLIKRLAWAYAALIMFSRIYLGVHFISDVVVGCMLGALISHAYLRVIGPLESLIERSPWQKVMFVVFLMCLIGHFLLNTPTYLFALGITCGAICSKLLLENRKIHSPIGRNPFFITIFSATLIYGGVYLLKTYNQLPIIELAGLIITTITFIWSVLSVNKKALA